MAEESVVVCPVCYHPLKPGLTICGNCGSTIPEETGEVLKNLMKIAGVGPDEAKVLMEAGLGVSEEDEEEIEDLLEQISGGELLQLCPKCGSFLSESSSDCPGCGEEVPQDSRMVAPPPPEEEASLFMCPSCGAFVSDDAQVCSHCGVELEEEEEEAPPPALTDTVQVGDITPVDEEVILCPSCGALVEEGDVLCGICGTDLASHRPIVADQALEADEEEAVCGNCGALLSAPGAVCKICGAGDEDEEVPEEPAEPPGPPLLPDVVSLEEEIDNIIADLESPVLTEEVLELPEEPSAPAVEVMAEADLESALETPLEEAAPDRTVLKPISAPSGSRGRRRHPQAMSRELYPQARVYVVYATLVALGVDYLLRQIALEGYELIVIILFGALLGSGVGLIIGSRSEISRVAGKRAAPIMAGAVLMTLVPLRAFLTGGAEYQLLDLGLLGVGGLLVLVGAVLTRSTIETSFVWLGGGVLLLLQALSRVPAAGLTPPESFTDFSVWVAATSLVVGAFVLVLYQKWTAAAMAGSIVSGDRSYRRRDYRASLKSYERAIEASRRMASGTNSEVPWYSKGAALVMLDRPEEALACIEKALEINPRSEVAMVNKGTALAKMGRHGDALRCYNTALKMNPTYEVAWNNKGNTLARMGKFEEAIRCYDESIKLDESYRDPWVNKGYVYVQLGDYEAAAECAERATKATTRVAVPS